MEDHHVDRPDVKARQRVQLTGTNRSFDLIALVAKARDRGQMTQIRGRKKSFCLPLSVLRPPKPVLLQSDVRKPDVGRRKKSPFSVRRPPSSAVRKPFFAGLVALARRSDPIPSRTRPSNALAPMVLCLKTWESRSSPGLQRTEIKTTEDRRPIAPSPSGLPLHQQCGSL